MMSTHTRRQATVCAGIALTTVSPPLFADEGGVSFWLPGNYGSFAAAPSAPGWALPVIYYHGPAASGDDKTFLRGGRLTAGLNARADFLFVAPTYILASPVAGGQAAVSVAGALGRVKAGVEATLTGPGGAMLSGGESDARTGLSDLYPTATLKWNRGVHSFMVYAAADVPVGAYDPTRLANIGINHWALDAGSGYTYLDEKNGSEFSAVLGFTYNFENHDTTTATGWMPTWTGRHRNSFRRISMPVSSAMPTTSSPATAAPAQPSATSSRRFGASDRRPAGFSRSAKRSGTSTSRATTNSTRRIGPMVGTPGSPWPSR